MAQFPVGANTGQRISSDLLDGLGARGHFSGQASFSRIESAAAHQANGLQTGVDNYNQGIDSDKRL
jgi:hypothetical protein